MTVEHGLPIGLAGGGIDVLLAQKADVVALHQRIHGGRVGMELAVIKLDRAAVLHAAMEGFKVALALDGLGNLWRGRGERKHEQRKEEHGHKQHVSLFRGGNSSAFAFAGWGTLNHRDQNTDTVSVCVWLYARSVTSTL